VSNLGKFKFIPKFSLLFYNKPIEDDYVRSTNGYKVGGY